MISDVITFAKKEMLTHSCIKNNYLTIKNIYIYEKFYI